MKRYKQVLFILEQILFIALVAIIVAMAYGYKFDTDKREFVLTGTLKIENLEDNAKVMFNNETYENKNNISASYLDEKNYDLKIEKSQRRPYLTQVQIKKGELNLITPILVPEVIKSLTLKENILQIKKVGNAFVYIYKENNVLYLEKLSISKSILSIDTTTQRINITNIVNENKINDLLIEISSNGSFAFLYTENKAYLIDINKNITEEITNTIPAGRPLQVSFFSNSLILKYENTLYVFNIEDVRKIQQLLAYTGNPFVYTVGENTQIFILTTNLKNELSLETYVTSGILQTKVVIDSRDFVFTPETKMINFNKKLYILEKKSLYVIEENNINQIDNNVIDIVTTDMATLHIYKEKLIQVINKDKTVDITLTTTPQSLAFSNDMFTFFYVDSNNKFHIGDIGGQDNSIIERANPSFIFVSNGNEIYLYYVSGKEIKLIKFGNNA